MEIHSATPKRRRERASERAQERSTSKERKEHGSRDMTEWLCVRNRGRRKGTSLFSVSNTPQTLAQSSLQGAWTGRVGLGRSQAFSYQRELGYVRTACGRNSSSYHETSPGPGCGRARRTCSRRDDTRTHGAQQAPSPSLGHRSALLNNHKKKKSATRTSVRAAGTRAPHTSSKSSLISRTKRVYQLWVQERNERRRRRPLRNRQVKKL
jgi:hypothetical protein